MATGVAKLKTALAQYCDRESVAAYALATATGDEVAGDSFIAAAAEDRTLLLILVLSQQVPLTLLNPQP